MLITPGPVPPSLDPARNAPFALSEFFEGDLVSTTWSTPEQAEAQREAINKALGGFAYHALSAGDTTGFLRMFRSLWYFARTGLRLSRDRGAYDAVVTYGPFTTAMAGLIIARRTGAALIVDLPGHPYRAFQFYEGRLARLKARVARTLVPRILNAASGAKLLYPQQLDDLNVRSDLPVAVFHDFTALGGVQVSALDEKYLLFLGYPWHLKGVDILIRAFLRIADRYPEHRLLIVGHCPDRTPFETLAAGHPRIEFRRGVFAAEAAELIARCSLLALPSRTEGMGRVILEAYAARKPVVASAVDGIPYVVRDGITGVLVPPADVELLASALDRVLGDRNFSAALARAGNDAAREHYTEEQFAAHYAAFVEKVLEASKHMSARTDKVSSSY